MPQLICMALLTSTCANTWLGSRESLLVSPIFIHCFSLVLASVLTVPSNWFVGAKSRTAGELFSAGLWKLLVQAMCTASVRQEDNECADSEVFQPPNHHGLCFRRRQTRDLLAFVSMFRCQCSVEVWPFRRQLTTNLGDKRGPHWNCNYDHHSLPSKLAFERWWGQHQISEFVYLMISRRYLATGRRSVATLTLAMCPVLFREAIPQQANLQSPTEGNVDTRPTAQPWGCVCLCWKKILTKQPFRENTEFPLFLTIA